MELLSEDDFLLATDLAKAQAASSLIKSMYHLKNDAVSMRFNGEALNFILTDSLKKLEEWIFMAEESIHVRSAINHRRT